MVGCQFDQEIFWFDSSSGHYCVLATWIGDCLQTDKS